MTKVIVYIATSLDGFIAGEGDDLDWLNKHPNPSKHDYGYGDLMDRVDGILMGRRTYEVVRGFEGEWPYSKRVYVLSSTLREVPAGLEESVEIVSGAPADVLQGLAEKGVRSVYVDGGKTVQSFLKEGLVDEMIITVVPVLLGAGVPLFGSLGRRINLRLVTSEWFDSGLVQSVYQCVADMA